MMCKAAMQAPTIVKELNIDHENIEEIKHIVKQAITAFFILTLKSITSKNTTTIDKMAIIDGNQSPYPKGIILKYEKYFVIRFAGAGAKVMAIPKGVVIKTIETSIQKMERIFFTILDKPEKHPQLLQKSYCLRMFALFLPHQLSIWLQQAGIHNQRISTRLQIRHEIES